MGEFVDVTFMVGDTVEAINTYQGTECTTYEGPATSTPFPLEIFCDKVVRGKYLKVYRTTALRKSLVFCEISVFSF